MVNKSGVNQLGRIWDGSLDDQGMKIWRLPTTEEIRVLRKHGIVYISPACLDFMARRNPYLHDEASIHEMVVAYIDFTHEV